MRLTWLGLTLIALGCAPARGGTSGYPSGTDAGADVPSGTDSATADTAAPPLDTGTAPDDAAVDASTPPDDQGVPPVDTGIGPVDTGAPPVDTGVTPVDAGCSATGTENTNATCGDGVDNDCDGFVDCNDFDCSRSPSVTLCPRDAGLPMDLGCIPTGAENTNATCGDGVDNDCDGYVDCIDFDCTRTGTLATVCRDAGAPVDTGNFRDAGPRGDAVGCVRTGDENNLVACNDGLDNDCDGYVECADRNCSCVGSCAPALLNCTCRGLDNTNANCVDRIDNDCNGFVDCSDFGCSRNVLVNVCGVN